MIRRYVFATSLSLAVLVMMPFAWGLGAHASGGGTGFGTTPPVQPQPNPQHGNPGAPILQPQAPSMVPIRPNQRRAAFPHDLQMTEIHSGRVFVKFQDSIRARATGAEPAVVSLSGADLSAFNQLISQNGLSVSQAMSKSHQELEVIRARAYAESGKPQPDLAGALVITGPRHVLAPLATVIYGLNGIHYVELEEDFMGEAMMLPMEDQVVPQRQPAPPARKAESPAQPTPPALVGPALPQEGRPSDDWQPTGPGGACCFSGGNCQELDSTGVPYTQTTCTNNGGTFLGIGTSCAAGACIAGACCLPPANTCVVMFPAICAQNGGTFNGAGTVCGAAGCQIGSCCTGVGVPCQAINQFDCDLIGGSFALAECNPPDDDPCEEEPDCGALVSGDCFDWANNTPYCDDEFICNLVCDIDPFCCDDTLQWPGRQPIPIGNWDELCVWHARRIFGGAPHPCFVGAGDCFAANGSVACELAGCCFAVCSLNPACCDVDWDATCVGLANVLCQGMPYDPAGDTPNLVAGQSYLTPVGYNPFFGFPVPAAVATGLNHGAPLYPPGYHAIRTDTHQPIQGWTLQGYDIPGLYNYAEGLFGPTGPENPNRTRGLGAKVAVVYPTAFVSVSGALTHEKLIDPNNPDRIRYAEPDQTQVLAPNSPTGWLNGQISTAVMGLIGATETSPVPFWQATFDQEFGIVGMVPEAEVLFYPSVSFEEGGRLANALNSAIADLTRGDVIVVPYYPRVGGTWAASPLMNDIFRVATDLGIITVLPAGNNMDGAVGAQSGEDSGVIIVGGVSPGPPYYRLNSTYCAGAICENDNAVHIAGWSQGVVALGGGDLYLGLINGTPSFRRAYTNRFGGTEAAAAQIASIAVMMQGFAKMMYGIALSPDIIRTELTRNATCTWNRCNPTVPPDTTGTFPDLGDWTLEGNGRRVGSVNSVDPQSGLGIASTGAFCDLVLTAESIVVGGFFDQCLQSLQSIQVVRGTYQEGNLFSVCTLDQVYYIARSQFTDAGSPGIGGSNVPSTNPGTYIVTGQIVDFLVEAKAPGPEIPGLTVGAFGNIPSGNRNVMFIEMYDWVLGRWWVLGGAPGMGGAGLVVQPFDPSRFVNPTNYKVMVRVWVYGYGGAVLPGGPTIPGEFDFRLDVVGVNFESIVQPQ